MIEGTNERMTRSTESLGNCKKVGRLFSCSAIRNPICTDADESDTFLKIKRRKLEVVAPTTKTEDVLRDVLFSSWLLVWRHSRRGPRCRRGHAAQRLRGVREGEPGLRWRMSRRPPVAVTNSPGPVGRASVRGTKECRRNLAHRSATPSPCSPSFPQPDFRT